MPRCLGLGYKMEFDVDLMIPDKKLSIHEGAITVWDGSPVQIREVLPEQFWMHWQENMIFIWIHLLRLSEEVQDILFMELMDKKSRFIIKDSEERVSMMLHLKD